MNPHQSGTSAGFTNRSAVTPAMAARITDPVWDAREFLQAE